MSGSRKASIAIEARDVQKSFALPQERHTTLKERVLHPDSWLRSRDEQLRALRGISFDVSRGEFFGIIGRNGSGKSTLLKLLASIYKLDGGSIRVAGRLAPFIELGVGFNLELAARDNVVLNGVMMGLSPAEARSRFEVVIDYAELHDYAGLKLKNYSSGMQVRLAFALMLQAEADVLLVDEVLAVGDAAFQEKCIASLEDLKRRGTTVVLVTHDMEAVEAHCDRAMLIEDGGAEAIGDSAAVAARYLDILWPAEAEDEPLPSEAGQGATVTNAWLSDGGGERVESVAQGEPVTVNLAIRANEETPKLQLAVELINNPEGVTIDTFRIGDEGEIPPLARGNEVTVRLVVGGPLKPGGYRFNYILGRPDRDRLLFSSRTALPLRVTGADPVPGVVKLDHRVSVDRGAVRNPG
ncbi:MAG: ABC transporter ATP-binding protein [Solirubrobacterales bacterium]